MFSNILRLNSESNFSRHNHVLSPVLTIQVTGENCNIPHHVG
jgi:hypothetical protein